MNALHLAAGWYTDPASPAHLRFWNGAAWSAHRKPRPGLPTTVRERGFRTYFSRHRRVA